MPVVLQAPPNPPAEVEPFTVTPETTSRRFMLDVLFSEKKYTVPGAILSVIAMVGMALMPVIVGNAIDRAVATGISRELWLWLGALAAIAVLRIFPLRLATQLAEYASQLAQHRLRASLSQEALHPSSSSSAGRSVVRPDGTVVSVMTNDVMRLGMLGLVVHPVGEASAILFIAVALFMISWPLGLAVLVGAPLVVWLMGRLSGQFARASRTYQGQLATTVARASDLVSGYRVIKGIRAEDEATERYRLASRETLGGALTVQKFLARYLAGSGSISGLFVVAVAALAGWFAVQGQMTVGGFITAVGLAQALMPQMQFITGNAVPGFAAASASSHRVLAALKNEGAAPDSGNITHQLPDVPVLRLETDGHETITVEPGTVVGIRATGRTAGAIVDAVLHPHTNAQYTNTQGGDGPRVSLSGVDANDIPIDGYRSRVTVSPHHAMLFDGSVADNVTIDGALPGDPDAVLHAAACGDFVNDAADAQVGETGGRLSGGQRQRVALARALASDAPVLVLHDPTTAVDSVTETVIADRLRDARRGLSTVLLTSSPALLAACDRVIDLTEEEEAGR